MKCKEMTQKQMICSKINVAQNMIKATKKLESKENVDYLLKDVVHLLQMIKVEIRNEL
jgi:hypothetical protein